MKHRYQERIGEHVSFLLDGDGMGLCGVCHESAGIITPGGRRYCGKACMVRE